MNPNLPTTIGSSEITSLLTIDQHIRQANQHCWDALPEKERSLKRVEQEITRLVQRAIKNIKEDELAFSKPIFSKEKDKHITDPQLVEIRKRHPRAYERWSKEEDRMLEEKFSNGASIQELLEFFQRQPGAIRSRLRKLEIS